MKRLSNVALLINALRYCDRRPGLGGGCYRGGIDAGGNRTGAAIRRQLRQQDSAALAALYTPDGLLVSPSGPIVRGREALRIYYTKRFASGARGHAIKVVEVHVQGNGGYCLAQFSVTVPLASGGTHEVHGSIVTIYQRDPDGWHMHLVEPSVPEPPAI
jgi:uncharacterized protein (TIGR02246 family)